LINRPPIGAADLGKLSSPLDGRLQAPAARWKPVLGKIDEARGLSDSDAIGAGRAADRGSRWPLNVAPKPKPLMARSGVLRLLRGTTTAALMSSSSAVSANTGYTRQVQEYTPVDTPLTNMLPSYSKVEKPKETSSVDGKFWDLGVEPPKAPSLPTTSLPAMPVVSAPSAGSGADDGMSPFQRMAQESLKQKKQ